jgi:hypothetical protein
MRPRFQVDFNELIGTDLVALSAHDTKVATSGETITLVEGLPVEVYDEDIDFEGTRDDLIASGVVARNRTGYITRAIWCCRINARGIRHQSDDGSEEVAGG